MKYFEKTAAELILINGPMGAGKTTFSEKLNIPVIHTDKHYRSSLTSGKFIKKILKQLEKYSPEEEVAVEGHDLIKDTIQKALLKEHNIKKIITIKPTTENLKLQREKRLESYNLSKTKNKMLNPLRKIRYKRSDRLYKNVEPTQTV